MKIKPVKHYNPPAYPTYAESKRDALLLGHLPRRWKNGAPLAPLMGSGLLLHLAFTGCHGNNGNALKQERAEQLPPDSAGKRDADRQVVRAIPATRIAPMLEEALANDGRGAFGCVALSAPVFLSENEALELILSELEKAGLKLRDIVAVDGLQVPESRTQLFANLGDEPRLKKLKKGAYAFDFGTGDKSVVVKFLHKDDYRKWTDDPYEGSTASYYDLSWLAKQMAETFRQRDEGDPVIMGLFFDPMVDCFQRDVLEKRVANNEFNDSDDYFLEANVAGELGMEKLRAQVLHFVAYLKQEGVVE